MHYHKQNDKVTDLCLNYEIGLALFFCCSSTQYEELFFRFEEDNLMFKANLNYARALSIVATMFVATEGVSYAQWFNSGEVYDCLQARREGRECETDPSQNVPPPEMIAYLHYAGIENVEDAALSYLEHYKPDVYAQVRNDQFALRRELPQAEEELRELVDAYNSDDLIMLTVNAAIRDYDFDNNQIPIQMSAGGYRYDGRGGWEFGLRRFEIEIASPEGGLFRFDLAPETAEEFYTAYCSSGSLSRCGTSANEMIFALQVTEARAFTTQGVVVADLVRAIYTIQHPSDNSRHAVIEIGVRDGRAVLESFEF